MDPITTVGAGLAILGSKDILVKILGPTADYVGVEIKNTIEKCNINLDNIFLKAKEKLADRLDEKGQVSPRVLKNIIDEGRFCEDELVAEYYGGVLATSKTESGRDDRGVALLAIIKDLSVYQLRLHYLFYSLIYKHFKGQDKNIGIDQYTMAMYIPATVYENAMQFIEDENPPEILAHSIHGLAKHGLIEPTDYRYGSKEHLRNVYKDATEQGMILIPSVPGAELYLWGQGIKGVSGHVLTMQNIDINLFKIPIIEGSMPTGHK